jgi:hypothetical protein
VEGGAVLASAQRQDLRATLAGARVGAILQAVVAREPAERRPVIRAWLPPHFLPPCLVTFHFSLQVDECFQQPVKTNDTR